MTTRHHSRRSRGVSLIEAMVALAIMGFGMLAVVGVQATLRLNADIAKQRSEATRLAQEAMEDQRAFRPIDVTAGQFAFADIATSVPQTVTLPTTNTTYTVSRNVVEYGNPPSKALSVTVAWNDRTGQPQQVILRSVIAAAAPALSGTLAVRPGAAAGGPVRRPFSRHPTIPVLAKDFGTGRSGFVPTWQSRYVFVFNNVTGVITGVCDFGFWGSGLTNDTITPSDVASCDDNTQAQLLSGFVRFWRTTSGPDLTAADVEDPPGPALRLRMRLTLTSTGHPAGSFCIDDANGSSTPLFNQTLLFVSYFCVIQSNTPALWSGTTEVEAQDTDTVGGEIEWHISDTTGGPPDEPPFRICRYTPATSDADTVANRDHPRNYADVSGNLTDQNFVAVPTEKHCPTDTAADPSTGDLINSNTLQHQPAP
jgi:Tfp pilus assembly protein PilV